MKRTAFVRIGLSLLVICVLVAATALTLTGCDRTTVPSPASSDPPAAVAATPTDIGTGATVFSFTAIDREGQSREYRVHTDETTVGAALLGVHLIAGDAGEFGLYIKQVCGITADYTVDQTYWAFYVDGAYAQLGVDQTPIEPGKTYALKVERG